MYLLYGSTRIESNSTSCYIPPCIKSSHAFFLAVNHYGDQSIDDIKFLKFCITKKHVCTLFC